MTQHELNEILIKHKAWVEGESDGQFADLRGADLVGADLVGANLTEANLSGANLTEANLRCSNLSGADLRGAKVTRSNLSGADLTRSNLSGADLTRSNLRATDLAGADLEGANLDFSCLPLWCGSLEAHFDDKQITQLLYHVVKAGLYSKNVSSELKKELDTLVPRANQFHRVKECGIIERLEEV